MASDFIRVCIGSYPVLDKSMIPATFSISVIFLEYFTKYHINNRFPLEILVPS